MPAEVVRRLSVAIDRPAAEAYAFLSQPENFPKWASGLAGSLSREGEEWIAETPEGRASVRFSEPNTHGVLDHSVTLATGATVYIPLRVVASEGGCELVLTLYRQPNVSEEQFAADEAWVRRDLAAAKRLLESITAPGR